MALLSHTKDSFLTQRISHLFKHAERAIPFNLLLGAAIVALLYLTSIHYWPIFNWLLILFIISLFRLLHVLFIQYHREWLIKHPYLNHTLFIIGALFTGVWWGILYWHFSPMIDVSYQTAIILIIAGLSAGSLISMSASYLAYYAFILPMVSSIIASYFIHSTTPSIILGIVIVLYTIFAIVAHHFNASMLFENIKLINEIKIANQKLKVLSMTDELTKIANRHHMKEKLLSSWIKAKHDKQPISLMIIDIDYFKEYNDHYGHLKGDQCIKKIAQIIDKNIKRASDLAARYGGDEFAVVLFNADSANAKIIAEKITQEVKEANIVNHHSKTADQVTLSIGISTAIPGHKEDYESLLIKADRALYQAKSHGRNQIAIFRAQ